MELDLKKLKVETENAQEQYEVLRQESLDLRVIISNPAPDVTRLLIKISSSYCLELLTSTDLIISGST
jgi:hypothetical protein